MLNRKTVQRWSKSIDYGGPVTAWTPEMLAASNLTAQAASNLLSETTA